MKLKLYFAVFASFTLIACSDNDSSSTNSGKQLVLQKIITYNPSMEAYNNADPAFPYTAAKRIQYYENGHITADSIIDAAGVFFGKIVSVANGNTVTETKILKNNTIIYTNSYTYDTQGRIVEFQMSENSYFKYKVTYSSNNTLNKTTISLQTGETVNVEEYTTNEEGLITTAYGTQTLTYENGRPSQFTQVSDGVSQTLHFTYYNMPVPANMLKAPAEVNNIILMDKEDKGITLAADNANRYIKSYDGYNFFNSTFNEAGYITHNIYTRLELGINTEETFYYYNE